MWFKLQGSASKIALWAILTMALVYAVYESSIAFRALPLQHNAILKDPKLNSMVAGHWQETLKELGIAPFPDKLASKAIRELPPESHVRFDLRRRKRALALPKKSKLNVAPEAAREEPPLDNRIFLERELNIFKRLNEDRIQADRAAGHLKRKQAVQSRRSSHQTARRSCSETDKAIKLL